MKPDSPEQFIGEVLEIDGELYVRNFFLHDKVYPLEKHPDSKYQQPQSLILGYISNGVTYVLKLLAATNSIQHTLYKIATEHELNPVFSIPVMQEVEEILANPGIEDPELINLEHLAFCTIDGSGTRDLDQALFIDKAKDNYRVYYALADAAFYVRPGTELFVEALQRGSSYYLPGLMIPMLPRDLCEGLISLNENVSRRAMVFELILDDSGVCIKSSVFRARIKSRAKLSFDKVQSFLDTGNQELLNDQALANSLKLLQKVGNLRLLLAEERNIVRYRRYEVNVKLGDDGFRFNILDNIRTQVEQYNEQLSLLCNVEGAKLLRNNDQDDDHIQPIYRIHPSPPESHILAFERLLQSLIEVHDLDPEKWSWQLNGEQSLADYLTQLPTTGEQSRIAQAIHRQAVMINVRSSFSEQASQHFGIGADVYARFSAPMREIVGIFLHKEIAEKLLAVAPILSKPGDDNLREQIIKIANRSKTIQKKITHAGNLLVLNQMFKDDISLPIAQRRSRLGTVIGTDNSKIYVLLDNPKIEVKVYIAYLEIELKTKLFNNDKKIAIIRSDNREIVFRLGDSVSIYVKEFDSIKNRWALII